MKAPKIPSIFFRSARRKPKQFNYKSRVYDERSERIQERKKEIETELKYQEKLRNDPEAQQLDEEYRNQVRFKRNYHKRQANYRFIIILVALLLLVYLLIDRLDFFSDSTGSIF